ncbi:hypothetical protein DEU56DRAFT_38350 [Suillus clintonianus]|uniref:uncharacterized protein n=1 Tax=Suillus clintonianus TaxID=1904413 RepID=UPI001B85E843|nr:uncharacterized protein DEU56DRAFT_38350 [Suillus clintonianus]KAG2124168.1 hypothetical protein DEU56DRAFT_38350 [Suillus clintonianus]
MHSHGSALTDSSNFLHSFCLFVCLAFDMRVDLHFSSRLSRSPHFSATIRRSSLLFTLLPRLRFATVSRTGSPSWLSTPECLRKTGIYYMPHNGPLEIRTTQQRPARYFGLCTTFVLAGTMESTTTSGLTLVWWPKIWRRAFLNRLLKWRQKGFRTQCPQATFLGTAKDYIAQGVKGLHAGCDIGVARSIPITPAARFLRWLK